MGMIGVFDSGVGGLSVLRHLRAQLPEVELVYLADQAHVPYGPRPLAEVQGFSEAITRFLRREGAEVIVVACNTASAAALQHLRARFPAVPFVGMEPAVKPAAEHTRTGVVGVLATPATLQGALFQSVVERFAREVRVLRQVCPGLVEQIEAGHLDTPETEAMLRGWVQPLLAEGIDALVLGCTHYPFVIPALERICGPTVRVIDPAPAVARQTVRVVAERVRPLATPREASGIGITRYYTTGDPGQFRRVLGVLGITEAAPGDVYAAHWAAGARDLASDQAPVTPTARSGEA